MVYRKNCGALVLGYRVKYWVQNVRENRDVKLRGTMYKVSKIAVEKIIH